MERASPITFRFGGTSTRQRTDIEEDERLLRRTI